MNITDYLLQSSVDDKIVLITQKEEYTYRNLKEAILAMIGAFQSIGIIPGDRAGILGSNSLFWVASYLATMKLGAIAVPFAAKLPKHELANQIEQVGCKVLCIEKRLQYQ